MNPDLLIAGLARLTVLTSAALLLLALARPVLQRTVGARAAYAAWLLVPLLLASPWLPAVPLPSPATAPVELSPIISTTQALLPALTPVASAAPAWPLSWQAAGLIVWLTGTMGLGAGLWRGQRRYRQQLRRDALGHWRAPAGHSPAVIGVWPARVVLPADFEQRFDADCRALMLAHEAVHLRRQDNAWNLFAAALLCLQWFNPLAWWGWHRLRADQELACDEAVLDATREPALRATYARALLAAHRGPVQPALACGWTTRHPLVERVQRVTRHRAASPGRRLGAWLLVAALGTMAAFMARAAQGPVAPQARPGNTTPGLLFTVESQVGDETWQRHELRLPLPRSAHGNPTGMTVQSMQPGWCLHLSLYAFGDGEVRPTALAMDETCQRPLAEARTLTANGSLAQFAAQTPQGALQAQVSARRIQLPPAHHDAAADAAAIAAMSPAQQQALARQRAGHAAGEAQLAAQDRAWRAAREAQPATR